MYLNQPLELLGALLLLLSLGALSTAQQMSSGDDVSESIAARDIFVRQADDSSMTNSADFTRQMLNGHNFFRAEHGASAIRWNNQRATASAAWSRRCVFQHSGTRGAGENIAAGYNSVMGVVNGWGSERTKYNYNRPGYSAATGHFTQTVWKGTTSLGCGRTKCPGMGWFTVCQYEPQGNIVSGNSFAQNVGRQTMGRATDVWRGQTAGGITRSVPFDSVPETSGSTGTSSVSSISTGEDSSGSEDVSSSTNIIESLSNVVYTTPSTDEIPTGGVFTTSRDDGDGDVTLTAAAETTNSNAANTVGSGTNRHDVSTWSILFGVVIGAAGAGLIRALH